MEKYPVSLSIDYADKSNRVTVLFRLLLAIPILIILALLSYYGYDNEEAANKSYWVGIVFLPTLLMILFRKKYPKWWFDWNLALTKFIYRVECYMLLLCDAYPSTDEEQAVQIDIPYPDVEKELNRWMPLIKWLLVLPHVFVLFFLLIGVLVCTILAWFIILLTGQYPRRMFEFVVGFLRWVLRVYAYAFLLTTDKYPPFRLSE